MSKKSTQISKKVLASALSAAMVVAFAPAVALADGANGNSDGGRLSLIPISLFLLQSMV